MDFSIEDFIIFSYFCIMDVHQTEQLCIKKEENLLTLFFGNLAKEAATEQHETIEGYTIDLPQKIAKEYQTFLATLWTEACPDSYKGKPLILEEVELRKRMTAGDYAKLVAAYHDATKQTLWERLTKNNHVDVTYYKGLMHEYTRELLKLMRIDFLEEITGNHIRNKTFENN